MRVFAGIRSLRERVLFRKVTSGNGPLRHRSLRELGAYEKGLLGGGFRSLSYAK